MVYLISGKDERSIQLQRVCREESYEDGTHPPLKPASSTHFLSVPSLANKTNVPTADVMPINIHGALSHGKVFIQSLLHSSDKKSTKTKSSQPNAFTNAIQRTRYGIF
ncbi:hypothetical protein WG66_006049 [Moniliophthora roreri]|nr:hypothetical protein WG66_006049 [Moniliophthora roreri]